MNHDQNDGPREMTFHEAFDATLAKLRIALDDHQRKGLVDWLWAHIPLACDAGYRSAMSDAAKAIQTLAAARGKALQ
jgi:hypothetical protein